MEKSLKLLKNLDLIGVELKPTLDGASRIKSIFGGILSLLMMFALCFGFGYFGLSMVTKDKPIMNNIQRKSVEASIPFESNPLFLGFYDYYNRLINFKSDFSQGIEIEVRLFITRPDPDPAVPYRLALYTGKTKFCEEADIDPKIWQDTISLGGVPSALLCLDKHSLKNSSGETYSEDLTVMNQQGDLNANFLVYQIKYCNEKLKPGCKAGLSKFGSITAIAYQMNYYIDPTDHSSPVKPDTAALSYKLTDQVSQTAQIYSQINEIVTDDSLFLTDTTIETYFSQGTVRSTVGLYEPEERNLLEFMAMNHKIISTNQRSYMKIPELLANMGGFYKGASILAKLLAYSYSHYAYFKAISRLETKHRAANKSAVNNFISKEPASNQAVNTSVSVTQLSPKTRPLQISYLRYLKWLLRLDRKANKLQIRKKFRFLELDHIVDCLMFVETLKNRDKVPIMN